MLLFSLSAASFAASQGRDVFFPSEFALIGYVLAAEGIGLLVLKGRKWAPMAFVAGVVVVACCVAVIILTPTRD
jgi:hypothetical protein